MNTNFIVTFFVGVGIYLIGLGIFSLIKFIVHKKKFKKEVKENEENQTNEQNQDSINKD